MCVRTCGAWPAFGLILFALSTSSGTAYAAKEKIGFSWLQYQVNPAKSSPKFVPVAGVNNKFTIEAQAQLNLPAKATIEKVQLVVWAVDSTTGGVVVGSEKTYKGEATANPLVTTLAGFNLYSIGRDETTDVPVQFTQGTQIKVAFQVKWKPDGGNAVTELFGEKIIPVP
jgi:hypothetical protein